MFLLLVSIHIKEVPGVGVGDGITVLPLFSVLVNSSKFNICRRINFGSVCI